MQTKTVFGFSIGMVVGLVIGVGVALLFAPKAGEELRIQLRAEADSDVRRVREEMNTRIHELNTRLDQARSDLSSQIAERLHRPAGNIA